MINNISLEVFGDYLTPELDEWLQKAIDQQPTKYILLIQGQMGTGKSEMLHRLVEAVQPQDLGYITSPKNTVQKLINNKLLALDNIHWPKLRDAFLIPIFTSIDHGNYTTKKLYSDETITINLQCAIAMTSIDLPPRQDILDRCLVINTVYNEALRVTNSD